MLVCCSANAAAEDRLFCCLLHAQGLRCTGLVQRSKARYTLVCSTPVRKQHNLAEAVDHVCGLNGCRCICLQAPAGGQGLCWLHAQGLCNTGARSCTRSAGANQNKARLCPAVSAHSVHVELSADFFAACCMHRVSATPGHK